MKAYSFNLATPKDIIADCKDFKTWADLLALIVFDKMQFSCKIKFQVAEFLVSTLLIFALNSSQEMALANHCLKLFCSFKRILHSRYQLWLPNDFFSYSCCWLLQVINWSLLTQCCPPIKELDLVCVLQRGQGSISTMMNTVSLLLVLFAVSA